MVYVTIKVLKNEPEIVIEFE